MITFAEARRLVIEKLTEHARSRPPLEIERVPLTASAGRVLATAANAERDYPPFDRSTRDGYAVAARDLMQAPATLHVAGEVRAGSAHPHRLQAGECVSIMTGAPVPRGADAVVMVEYTRASGDAVTIERTASRGENVVQRGSELRAGDCAVPAGRRLGYAEVAMLATFGVDPVDVYTRPRVAILPTGDEVVEVSQSPLPHQIRNSNSYSLVAQARAAGAEPRPMGIARDDAKQLRSLIEHGLERDLLLLSGGVSMGKYDLVEQVLRELGAELYFDAVAIQPGKPVVFGRAGKTHFFGLPGNPLSTMVTFELFARPAIEILAGIQPPAPLLLLKARLGAPVRHKPGLTRFLPARLSAGVPGATGALAEFDPQVELLKWQGSGDVAAMVRANCYIVVPGDREDIPAGEWVSVLPRN